MIRVGVATAAVLWLAAPELLILLAVIASGVAYLTFLLIVAAEDTRSG